MKKIYIRLIALIVTACDQRYKETVYRKECVVDSIYQMQRSTIEVDKKFVIVTDCGSTTLTTENPRMKKGDTIIMMEVKRQRHRPTVDKK